VPKLEVSSRAFVETKDLKALSTPTAAESTIDVNTASKSKRNGCVAFCSEVYGLRKHSDNTVVCFVGDQLSGDIISCRKHTKWMTVYIMEEVHNDLEEELETPEGFFPPLAYLPEKVGSKASRTKVKATTKKDSKTIEGNHKTGTNKRMTHIGRAISRYANVVLSDVMDMLPKEKGTRPEGGCC